MEPSVALSRPFRRHIRPAGPWWQLDWAEFWHYRDLLVLLVRRDFLARYAQSVLGPAWFVVQPLLTTLVFAVIFGVVVRVPTGGLPPILFYLCNQLPWIYFSNCFLSASGTLVANQHLFSKVYFPRLIVPVANLVSNAFTLLIQLGTFLLVFAFYKCSGRGEGFALSGALWLLPLLSVQAALLAAGCGLLFSALTAKYRDLAQLSSLLIQLGLYATPVIYPLSAIPERWRWLAELNPMSFIVEGFRLGLLGSGTWSWTAAGQSVAVTLVLLLLGLITFTKVERTFVDVA